MNAARRTAVAAALVCAALACPLAKADTVSYEDVDGIRYQVTKRTMQVPITQTTPQQQVVYQPQVTTQTIQHQQLYSVPVTQYQLVSTLHGRWNPFITPYWTHEYKPVTTWQQQTATVQVPVNTTTWAQQSQTVQVPSTTYRPVDAIVSRIPIGATPGALGSSQQMMASNGTTTSPSAMLAARPAGSPPATAPRTASATPLTGVPSVASAPTTYGAATSGGTLMNSDPPRQGTGWQTPSPSSYR